MVDTVIFDFDGTLAKLKIDFVQMRQAIDELVSIFQDISSYCSVVVCRDDVKHVKPHPEQLTLALKRLGSSSARSLMVGDHPLDIETGQNAGTLTAGVLTGHFRKDDFIRSGANIVLSQAPDVLKLLR